MSTTPAQAVKPAIAVLPNLEKKRARAEWPFEVGLVPLAYLIVDDTYQRPGLHDFVLQMAQNFDETLVGTIDVSQRKGSIYAILDGQQRFLAMQQVGKTACYCSIYTGMTVKDEAGFFYRKNKDRRTMSAYYSFRARVVAGDDLAIMVQLTVEKEGFVLGQITNERDVIGSIRAVEKVYGYASEHRDESLTPTLQTIRGAFFGRKGSLDSILIDGIGRFWQVFADSEVREEKLFDAIGEIGPIALKGAARDAAALSPRTTRGGTSIPLHVARKMLENYNRSLGSDRKFRLDPRRLSI